MPCPMPGPGAKGAGFFPVVTGRSQPDRVRRRVVPSSRPLYERWPYPDIPVVASVSAPDLWQLHLDWMRSEAGLGPGPARPRVWIAGCGAWQSYPVAVANPQADILATDVSETSLGVTRRRLAVHLVRNVTTAWQDLDDPSSYPDGPFDWIECFGVLMNLPDPAGALRRFAARLAPGGLVRLMVYPWSGRRRVFQIARIAALLGLGHDDPRHPGWLGALMRSLPADHPLRFTFEDYTDAATPAGVVDGFLHVSGVSFSAHELFRMVDDAGLELAFTLHRPWGDPWAMGPTLGLDWDPWAVLHALDAWQELKSNFIVVLRRKGDLGSGPARLHPVLDPDGRPWSERLGLWRGRALGLRLQDRRAAGGALTLTRQAYGGLLARQREGTLRASDSPLVCFGEREPRRPALGFALPDEAAWREPRLWLGRATPHPAWQHQLRAFELGRVAGLGDESVEAQLARWGPHAAPLEDEDTPYGFSPVVTGKVYGDAIRRWATEGAGPEIGWDDARLAGEAGAFGQVRAWAGSVDGALGGARPDGVMRELWALTFGYRHFLLSTDGG